MSEPTQQQKCADLARAMEWDFIPSSSETALPDVGEWYTPLGKIYGDEPPDPFTDHAACHALVAWLATQQRNIQQRFVFAVRDETAHVDLCYELRILTAEPAVIAEAAWLAIKEDSSASQ